MSLTFPGGPLSGSAPPEVNYELDGPAHKLLFQSFPRRVRVEVAGRVLIDTVEGKLLHETGILPVFYAPEADIDTELLSPSERHTHCPFKGEASYMHFDTGDQKLEDLLWFYPEPIEGAGYIRGYVAPYRERVDWFDEDEQIYWHLRDPYQRVDARRTTRRVEVKAGEELIAESDRPVVISETGHPNRFYLPREDVRAELLPSEKQTHCPYKGDASWHSLRLGEAVLEDAAWSYEDPFEDALKAKGMLCFADADHDDLFTEVDGKTAD